MTKYEKLIAAGPMELAKLIVLSKIRMAEIIVERLGLSFEYSDEHIQQDIQEHYDHLMEECEE